MSGKWAWESDAGYKKRMEEENNESLKRMAKANEKRQKDERDYYDYQMSQQVATVTQRNTSSQNNQSGGSFDIIKFLVLLPIGLIKIIYRHVINTYERALELSNHRLLTTFLMLFTPLAVCIIIEISTATISVFTGNELGLFQFIALPITVSSVAMVAWIVAKRYPISHRNLGYVLRSIGRFVAFSVLSWVISLIVLVLLL